VERQTIEQELGQVDGVVTAAGATAVLIYPLISCWPLLPAGGLSALLLRRGGLRTRIE
jgi:hypothetical protein